MAMRVAELRDLADSLGLDHDGLLKKELRGLILDEVDPPRGEASDPSF